MFTEIIYDRLKCLPNKLDNVEYLLSRLVTKHFLPCFIYLYASAALLIHWFMLVFCISTDFFFASCCCSCFLVRVVAVCTFGVLQPRLELRHSWWTDCFLLLCSLCDVYCCLIRLCRVRILQLHLGLLVLLNWVVICCLFLFA
jgi:hypothetical protein